jgi:predicted dehydrogenase
MSVRLAVVGCGRMGKLHARVLSDMPDVELACVVDVNPAAAAALARQYRCLGLTDVASAVERVDGAIIATPTLTHLEVARPFVAAGKHVLIEKPSTHDPVAGAELVALAERTGTGVQVGHTERFNPVVLAMQKHAIAPKFIEAHRISPFTFRSADVGVVLDMMIHDIDLVRMMVRGGVRQLHAVGVNVIGAHEDIANARLIFDNGCVANLTASRLAIKTERKMRVFSEQAYLSVDYGKKTGIVVTKSANLDLIQMARDRDASDLAELAAKLDYVRHLKVEHLTVDESTEPLRRQAEAFRMTVAEGAPPVVSARDGLAAVQLAADIVAAIKHHRWDGDASSREGLGVITKDG